MHLHLFIIVPIGVPWYLAVHQTLNLEFVKIRYPHIQSRFLLLDLIKSGK